MKRIIALALFGYAFNAGAADWIAQAQAACTFAKQSPAQCESATAIVRRAMDATRNANGNGNGSHGSNGGHSQLEMAAQAVAAYVVLESLYPEQQPEFENRLAVVLADIPESQAKADALARGRRVASETLAAR